MDALLHALQSAVGKKDTDNKVNLSIKAEWMFALIYAEVSHWDPTSVCWYQMTMTIFCLPQKIVIVFLSFLVSVVLLMGYEQDAAVFPSMADEGSKGWLLREVGRVVLYCQWHYCYCSALLNWHL